MFCAVLTVMVVWVNAGNLNPPAGPVASTMKPLDIVEPRTPISSLPFTISQPGSYYVTKDLTGTSGQHGIIVNSSDVSLDLSGFALHGVLGSLDGIRVSGARTRIHIHDGMVSDWGGGGINSGSGTKVTMAMVKAEDDDYGVCCGNDHTVVYMQTDGNSTGGIILGNNCICKDSSALDNTGTGITTGSGCKIEDCVASSNGASGISAGSGSIVKICTVQANGSDGINAAAGCTVSDCNARGNTGDGIEASSHCLVLNNNVSVNGIGIHIVGSPPGGTRVEANNAAFNTAFNFDITSAGNFIVKNSSAGPGTGYNFAAGNDFGAIITLGGGGPFTSANAWANFDY